jgi:dolichyl-phosphate-mannose-protein mannosyltransferase
MRRATINERLTMKSSFLSEKSIIILLLVLGITVHALWFGNPSSAVFDEVHFGKFISAYFTHEYYFDIHPPLGKLVLAGWGWLWGFQPGFSFANIGDAYPDRLYLALRFLPAFAGALLPLIVYGVARRLGIRPPAAFLAGAFVALDNALLVQSRFILLDSFMLLFGFGTVYCYLHYSSKLQVTSLPVRQAGYRFLNLWLVASGLLGGMALSIKWTGGTFLALIILLEFLRLRQLRQSASLPSLVKMPIVALIVVPAVLYFGVFVVHFALLGKSGPGDAFMSPAFQHGLQGNMYASDQQLQTPTLWEKFVELNDEMYSANQRLTATHPYSSMWYTWPFMDRAIFYWTKDTARIYLLGNPLVWWASTAAVLIAFSALLAGMVKPSRTVRILCGAWLLNLVPFVGISRVMFLYHYFTALMWAILILAWLIDRGAWNKKTILGMIFLAAALFAFFAPLSYGLPLSERAYNARVWFPGWR